MESDTGSSSSLPTPEAPQQPFRYLSLPAEVRKQIMTEAFIIGGVHVHPLPTQKRTPTTVASILDAPSRKHNLKPEFIHLLWPRITPTMQWGW